MRYRLTLEAPTDIPLDEGRAECYILANALISLADKVGEAPVRELRVDSEGLLIIDLIGVSKGQKMIMEFYLSTAQDIVWMWSLPWYLKSFALCLITTKQFLRMIVMWFKQKT